MKGLYSIMFTTVLFLCGCATTQLKYDNIYSFQNNYALVQKDGKYGLIDTSFQEIIYPALDNYLGYDLSPYFFNSSFYGIKNDSLIIYNTSGEIIHHYKMDNRFHPNILSDQSYFIDTLQVRTADNNYTYSGSKNWGCISISGDTIIPFEYERIKEGLDNAIIGCRGGNNNLETYVYNSKGDTLWRTYNVAILPWKINNYYFFNSPDRQIQIKNSRFESIDTIYFDDIVLNEKSVWLKSDSLWSRYDSNLEFIDGPYEKLIQNKHWGVIWKDKTAAIINSNGEIITPFIYEGSIYDYISNSTLIVARNKEQIDVLNLNGEILRSLKR
ncbi:MAG: WG repeat-containing protein [Crocinitomicaceae bacterium]|nr:WG repeat-containing protein [Crocinitomicaceae bacterium]